MSRQIRPVRTTLLAGAAALAAAALLAITGLTVTSQVASATPALAKGKACPVCHTGSPPTKANVKKK